MKKCFKCFEIKALDEFYKHPKMLDGHLNKCKCCSRKDSEMRRKIKELDEDWVKKEAERHRNKSAKSRKEGRASQVKQNTKEKYRKNNPEKRKAHNLVAKAIANGSLTKQPCQ